MSTLSEKHDRGLWLSTRTQRWLCWAALAFAACAPTSGPGAQDPAAAAEATAAEAAGDAKSTEGAPAAEAQTSGATTAAPAAGSAAPGTAAAGESVAPGGLKAKPVDLSGVKLKDSLQQVSVPVDGAQRELVVIGADDDAKGPRPLVVFLHGAKSSGLNEALRCLVQRGFESVAPIVVAPKSGNGQWWTEEEAGFVLGVIEAAKKQWPVNPNQIVVSGFSNGGIGAWALARLQPQVFSAAIPIAGNETIVGETTVPVYDIHGSKDDQFPLPAVEQKINELKQKGFDVTLAVRNRGTHAAVCAYGPELEGASKWLTDHAWKAKH
jgi:dienelactone hydrolase